MRLQPDKLKCSHSGFALGISPLNSLPLHTITGRKEPMAKIYFDTFFSSLSCPETWARLSSLPLDIESSRASIIFLQVRWRATQSGHTVKYQSVSTSNKKRLYHVTLEQIIFHWLANTLAEREKPRGSFQVRKVDYPLKTHWGNRMSREGEGWNRTACQLM